MENVKKYENKLEKNFVGDIIDKKQLVNKNVTLTDWVICQSEYDATQNYVLANVTLDEKQYVVILPHIIATKLKLLTPPIMASIITRESSNHRVYYDIVSP